MTWGPLGRAVVVVLLGVSGLATGACAERGGPAPRPHRARPAGTAPARTTPRAPARRHAPHEHGHGGHPHPRDPHHHHPHPHPHLDGPGGHHHPY